ncbi:hypothetical protein DTL21_21785 [Bremerella cremea]|uniref:Uncharacterized protein n=1 Tax=Blastopirellula marina TaxID=124 RepID=A0A2S8FLN9_9BACT|nr:MULTISPECIES: hypothetical protein [Pirellulaceae]PQO32814.1 hypothetical protein C5Y83_21765 [Blastopirellula marina]RCS45880.1 hypothetical protein DTL21_21785 [Bremerella cremea]
MTSSGVPYELAFVPSRVEGHVGVTLVRVFPDRMVIKSSTGQRVVRFRKIARYHESLPRRILWRMLLKRPSTPSVAYRDWFHAPPERFFRFHTSPPLTITMPVDEPADYAASNFFAIQQVIRAGGYETLDLG